jgi:crotonobetainyl-CoA:carnitine CoA-transferase CaiB-like acyl-CoA transferase
VAFVGTEPNRRYYRAADGWVAIAVPVGRLGELLAWAGAREHDDAAAVIARAVAVRNAADVVAELSARGIAAVRVVERDEIATDPHLVAHRLFHVVSDDEVGRCRAVHQVAAWSRSIPVDATRGPGREPDAPVWLGPGSPATACGSAG